MARLMPQDSLGNITAAGTSLLSFSVAGDGTFKPIVLPGECKNVVLTCRDAADTFTHTEDAQEFHLSSKEDGSDWIPLIGITLSVSAGEGGTLCYCRCPVGFFMVGLCLS